MQWLKNLVGLVTLSWLPPARRWRTIYWTVHILVVVLVVVALGYLNIQGGLDRVLRTRWLGVDRVWLPLLFLLGYALFWLIRWLYWLLGPDGVVGEFDDLETAWASARQELERVGLDLRMTPVFLVLGRTEGNLEQVFSASRLPLQVRNTPADEQAPLHVFANREAIFVTAEGASLLAVQAARLIEGDVPAVAGPAQPLEEYLEPAVSTPVVSPDLAVGAEARAGAVLLLGETENEPDLMSRPRREALLTDREQVELQTRRLRHLCRILGRDRRPYCPVNGMLLLLPLAATANPVDASETAGVIRHDLEVARGALQLDCPRLVVMGGAERIPGFAELLRHFPQEGTGPSWVLGQHFPLIPDVPAAQAPALIEQGVSWVGDSMLPLVISQLWRREGEEGVTEYHQALEANILLYEFLDDCRKRLALLGRLAARGVHVEGAPAYLGGCYLAGTGADAAREQGFLGGVLRRLIEQQNHVRWTGDALADDEAYHRFTFVGYILLAIFVVVIALILIAWW
ncbi:MAG: type VI secretion protein IcmF/TssM N-terminal domain-containing protein [Gemmataceae bacterium]